MRINLKTIGCAVFAAVVLVGCARLPYQRSTETSVAGAAAGAVAGAVLAGDDDQMLGALLGGALGAATGYVIGAETGWFGKGNEQAFDQAVISARNDPATVSDVYGSNDADLNNDGLVTQDELVALSRAGLSTDAIIERLEATNQVFHINAAQRQSLLDAGVDPQVVARLENINQG